MIKIIFLAIVVLSGCGPSFKIDQEIEASLKANAEAKNYQDWLTSGHHPEAMANRYIDLLKTSDTQLSKSQISLKNDIKNGELCRVLSRYADEDIEFFYFTLIKEENKSLIKGCEQQIQQRLSALYIKTQEQVALEKAKIENPEGLAFKVIKRDMKSGPEWSDAQLPNKHVVLTFDDGPHQTYTQLILETLERYKVKAHFFIVGNSVKRNQDNLSILEDTARLGHSIGNHSMSHPCMGSAESCKNSKLVGANYNNSVNEIISTHQLIFEKLGFVDPIFRFPYGASTPQIRGFVKNNQLANFRWNIDSEDWRLKQSSLSVLKRTFRVLEQQKKGIILFHDINNRAPKALPVLLEYLKKNNYTVVLLQPLDDLSKVYHPLLKRAKP